MHTEDTPVPTAGKIDISPVQWAIWLSAFLVFVVVMSGKVRYTEGDSRYSLLATTALIERGSFRLDAYDAQYDLRALNNGRYWQVNNSGDNGHLYYDYPIGTPIFSVPFVMVGKWMGFNPLQREDDTAMQLAIAAILCASVFLLLVRLSRLYLGDWTALLFSLAVFFGSTLTSTMGTALWSHNTQTFFVFLAVLELAEWDRGKRSSVRPYWLGFLLFMCYLCRPTSAALIVPVFAVLAWKDRPALLRTMATAATGLLLFVVWSKLEMGMWLPRYYDPTLWQPGPGTPMEHWMPIWFGPARGLWSFTPVFFLVFLVWAFKGSRLKPLQLMVWPWLLLHTWLLVRSQSPWAGWSYGPRFFTEMLPGLILLLLIVAAELHAARPALRQAAVGAFVVCSFFGVYVHTLQGLGNQETMTWNDSPNIDMNWAERRWDWSYPQFFASANQRMDRIVEREWRLLADQLLRRVPDGAAILMGNPDPQVAATFEEMNTEPALGGKRIYNSLYSVLDAGHHGFYFQPALLAKVREIPKVRIDSVAPYHLSLGQFLEANPAHEIVIACKDEGSSSPAAKTRDVLRSMGAAYDSLKLRDSYILHIQAGRVVHEEFGQRALQYRLPGSPAVLVKSAGLFVGNEASIKVDGIEYAHNLRGLNVVLLDADRKVLWAASFDTHADDRERQLLWKADW